MNFWRESPCAKALGERGRCSRSPRTSRSGRHAAGPGVVDQRVRVTAIALGGAIWMPPRRAPPPWRTPPRTSSPRCGCDDRRALVARLLESFKLGDAEYEPAGRRRPSDAGLDHGRICDGRTVASRAPTNRRPIGCATNSRGAGPRHRELDQGQGIESTIDEVMAEIDALVDYDSPCIGRTRSPYHHEILSHALPTNRRQLLPGMLGSMSWSRRRRRWIRWASRRRASQPRVMRGRRSISPELSFARHGALRSGGTMEPDPVRDREIEQARRRWEAEEAMGGKARVGLSKGIHRALEDLASSRQASRAQRRHWGHRGFIARRTGYTRYRRRILRSEVTVRGFVARS